MFNSDVPPRDFQVDKAASQYNLSKSARFGGVK